LSDDTKRWIGRTQVAPPPCIGADRERRVERIAQSASDTKRSGEGARVDQLRQQGRYVIRDRAYAENDADTLLPRAGDCVRCQPGRTDLRSLAQGVDRATPSHQTVDQLRMIQSPLGSSSKFTSRFSLASSIVKQHR
jgi:hypothetical protein